MLVQRFLRLLYQILYQSDKSHHKEQALLLQALDRDLLEALYCFLCNRLHVLFPRHEHGRRADEIYKRVSDGLCYVSGAAYNYGTRYFRHAAFRFEHIQMAMKLDRRGLLSDAKAYWKVLTYPQPTQGFMTLLPTTIGLHFFEPRFVKDQISLRAQNWILMSQELGSMMSKERHRGWGVFTRWVTWNS